MDDLLIQFFRGKPEAAEIQPEQIRAFRFLQFHTREAFFYKRNREVDVLFHIGFHRFIPFISVGISSLRCFQSEHVGFIEPGNSDLVLHLFPDLRVGNKNVGLLEPCEVKGLAGGRACDRKFRKGRIHFLEDVVRRFPDKVKMDLIGKYDHMMLFTDISDP